MSEVIFPLGIASGDYFCNRVKETEVLVENIRRGTHTVLIAPRRYGKTSLAYRAINQATKQANCLDTNIDLYLATSVKDIELSLLSGIGELLAKVSNSADQLLALAKDSFQFFKSLRPSFDLNSHGEFTVKLLPSEKSISAINIQEALEVLERVFVKKQKRAVLFIDEFQEIERIAPNAESGIEGAIRHVIQQSQQCSVIFSGSHRRLLKNMFNDRSKPLYRLCDEINLSRISEADYLPFIKDLSVKEWGEPLSEAVILRILTLTERHPYYINALCDKLFRSETLPEMTQVDQIWEDFMKRAYRERLQEAQDLNLAQKKMLVAIANGRNAAVTGQDFLRFTELSSASAHKAKVDLEENDFIEESNGVYTLIDPLLASVIREAKMI